MKESAKAERDVEKAAFNLKIMEILRMKMQFHLISHINKNRLTPKLHFIFLTHFK